MNKIKGITIWEQHAEYFALGLATLALVAFVAMQVIGDPNAVEVSGHGTVRPGDVDQRLVDAAQDLQSKLSPTAAPTVAIGDPRPVLPEFEQALAASISPTDSIRTLVASVPLTPGERVRVGETFMEPYVPTPTATVARQYFDTLTDHVVVEHGLDSRFPSTPYDVTWITPAAAIDLEQVLQSFKQSGPGGSPAPIPTSWHADLATVLDVRVQREELIDGQWTNRIEIDPLPGQYTYRHEIADGIDAPRRDALLRAARDVEAQRQLARPSFYETRNGSFVPPDPLEPEFEIEQVGDDEHARGLRRLLNAERDRASVKSRLDDLGGPLEGSPPRPGTPGGTAPGGSGPPSAPGGFGAGTRGADSGTGAGEDDRRRSETARRRLTERLARLDREIESLRSQLAVEEPLIEHENDGSQFVVWAHDIDVTPGDVYRYRIVVDIYNPFFARRLNLVDEQQDLADSLVISSSPSEWSEPIQARAPLHPFITRAYAPGQERGAVSGQGMGHAVAEIYRFYDGRWWSSQFTLEPGQRVGAIREERGDIVIDYGTEWFVLDIIEDIETDTGSGPGREGRAATVVLQHMHNGEVTELRHPSVEISSPTRVRLQDEARFADAS